MLIAIDMGSRGGCPPHIIYNRSMRPLKEMTAEPNIQNIQAPITKAPPEVKEIIERVLQLEKDKLYLRAPRGINDDIIKVIKEIVR